MPGYGYSKRIDREAQLVPAGSAGESRVATPGNAEARRTDIAAKQALLPAAAATLDAITQFPRFDRTQWLGKDVSLGWPNSATSWQTDTLRYCRTMTATNAIKQELFTVGLEPAAYVDPAFLANGIIVRIRDVVRAKFAGALNAQLAKANFTIGQVLEATGNIIPPAKIGFQAVYSVLNVQPTWTAYYSSFDGSVRQVIDSGVKCDVPRLLEIELDGALQEIRWWVDGIKVASFSPAANTAPGQNATTRYFPVSWTVYGSGNGASTGKLDFLMGGAPLVTYQFPDV